MIQAKPPVCPNFYHITDFLINVYTNLSERSYFISTYNLHNLWALTVMRLGTDIAGKSHYQNCLP